MITFADFFHLWAAQVPALLDARAVIEAIPWIAAEPALVLLSQLAPHMLLVVDIVHGQCVKNKAKLGILSSQCVWVKEQVGPRIDHAAFLSHCQCELWHLVHFLCVEPVYACEGMLGANRSW